MIVKLTASLFISFFCSVLRHDTRLLHHSVPFSYRLAVYIILTLF